MLKIGITASIGAGKTTISKLLEIKGFAYINTDELSKSFIKNNLDIKNKIIKKFGEETYLNNDVNIPYLSNIVFSNTNNRKYLEKILEPLIREYILNFEKEETNKKVLIIESAIFYETNTEDIVDLMIGVDAPESIRLKRVMSRNNLSLEDVEKRMNIQLTNEFKMEQCDFVIDNSGDFSDIIKNTLKIHKLINKIANL